MPLHMLMKAYYHYGSRAYFRGTSSQSQIMRKALFGLPYQISCTPVRSHTHIFLATHRNSREMPEVDVT